jgi:hypothetical protein
MRIPIFNSEEKSEISLVNPIPRTIFYFSNKTMLQKIRAMLKFINGMMAERWPEVRAMPKFINGMMAERCHKQFYSEMKIIQKKQIKG